MKYKHTITIADIQMNIITEEDAEVVESMVGVLDRRMREIFLKSQNRCTKIEAALLCALDYCSEKSKLQETVAKMEEEMRGVDVNAMFEQIETLKAENEKLSSQLTYSEDQTRTMKNGIDIANDQIRILKTQVSDAEAKTVALVEELDGAKQAAVCADELKEKIAALEAAIAAKDAEIEAKTAECEEKIAECDDLNKAYEEATEKIGKLEGEIAELEQRAESTEEAQVEIVEEIGEKADDEVIVEIVVEEEPAETTEEVLAEAVADVTAEVIAEEVATETPAEPEKRPVAAIADNIEEVFELDMKPLRRGSVDENQLTIDSELGGEDKPEEKPAEKTTVEKEKQKAHKRVRSMFDLITFDNV